MLNIYLLLLLVVFDAIVYGYFWEKRKNKLGFVFWSLKYKERNIYPVYRTIQGILDISSIYVVYHYNGLIPAMGFILSWYFMTKEYLYYVCLWQWQVILNYENNNEDVYWLKRIWFSGLWLFGNKYTFLKFTFSFILGLAILIISNFL